MPKKKGELSIEERLEQSIVAKEEMPYKLPSNWVWTRLENIGVWGAGGTPSRKNQDFYLNGTIPWLKTGDLNNGIVTETEEYITEEAIKKSSAKIFKKDSIGIAMYGATIGKIGIFAKDMATNQACAVVKAFNEIENMYLFYFFKNVKERLIEKAKGGAQPNISQEILKNFPFNLPPLEEQKRIVEKLDSLFEKIQKIKEIIEEVKEKTTSRREAILSKAFSGELTEKWRGENHTENARELLVKINDEKLKLWEDECKKAEDEGRKKPAKPKLKTIDEMLVGAEEEPYKLPNNWVWTRLGDITDILNGDRGKNYPSKDKLLENGEIPFISAVNLEDGQILKENLLFLSNEQYEKLRAGKLRENDLLFCIRGSLGKFGKNYFLQGAIASSLVIVRNILKNKETINFIENYFRTLLLKNEIAKYNNGTAQPNLSAENFKKFLLPLPPLEEQKEIVRVLDKVFEEENRISELISLENKIEILEKTILDRAFRGELGTGNNDDEPAIELLRRCLEGKR